MKNTTFIKLLYAFTLVVLAGALVICMNLHLPFFMLSRDPIAIGKLQPYHGFLSNLGAIFWSFSVATCFLGYQLFIKQQNRKEDSKFIAFAGILSVILLIDDFFLFHEEIFSRYFHLNELYLFAVYGLLFLYYVFAYKSIIQKSNYIFLIVSFCFFLASIIVDVTMNTEENYMFHHLFEDGFKFVGIISWFCYHFLFVKDRLLTSV